MLSLRCKLISGFLAAVAICSAGPGFAQGAAERSVDQYVCKDIMRDNGANRDVAIGFLHGFLLARSGATKFNVEALEKQTDAFIEYCLDHPGDKALDAMAKAKK